MELLRSFERDGFVKIEHWDGLPLLEEDAFGAQSREELTEFGNDITYKVMDYNPWSGKFEYLPKRVRLRP